MGNKSDYQEDINYIESRIIDAILNKEDWFILKRRITSEVLSYFTSQGVKFELDYDTLGLDINVYTVSGFN